MAIIVAVRSGNWSDTSHETGPWPGESTPTTKPATGDTVQTGEFVITIDEDVTVALLESTSMGYFQVTDAPAPPAQRTITANVLNSGTAPGALKTSNPTGLVVWTGNVTAGAGDAACGVHNKGTVGNVTGDAVGGAGASAYGINNAGTMGNINGNVTAGAGDGAYGINNAIAMGNVTGNVTAGAGAGAYGINNAGTMGNIDGALVCGAGGLFPVSGPFRLVANPANAATFVSSTDTPLTLSNDYPAEADVKTGVDYNRGTMTGELAAGGSIGPVSIVIGGGGIRIF